MSDLRALQDFMDEDEVFINIPISLLDPGQLTTMRKSMKRINNEIGRVLFDGQMAAKAVGEFLYRNGQCSSRVGGEKGIRCSQRIGHEGPHYNSSARWT